MRCRKVRSLLSAACSEELVGRQQVAVREHVAGCQPCRTEASYYSSIRQATKEMPPQTVSDDFNARLLNRIARERFAETRTKAYQPKNAPLFMWRKLVPVAVMAALLAVVAINLPYGDQPLQLVPTTNQVATASDHMDDSYRTVQPTDNPNMTVGMKPDWTLAQQLAKTERLEQISRGLVNPHGFSGQSLASSRVSQRGRVLSPAMHRFFHQRRSIMRIYYLPGHTASKEDVSAY